MKKLKTEEFIKKLKSKFKNLPYTVIGTYINLKTKILIENEYGELLVLPSGLMAGKKPSITSAICKNTYFKNRAIEVHKEGFDYSKINFITMNNKINLTCRKCGYNFDIRPYHHLNGVGCKKCSYKRVGDNYRRSSEDFYKIVDKIHNGNYSYPIKDFTGGKNYITIFCKRHGIFNQKAAEHIRGVGCNECGNERTRIKNADNPCGWSHASWKKAGKSSKNFNGFKCYIIKCWNDKEEFYKIGKTFTTVEKRFRNKRDMPYNYEMVKLFEGEARKISKLEKKLQKQNKKFEYIPNNVFEGMYECFSSIKILLKYIEDNNI